MSLCYFRTDRWATVAYLAVVLSFVLEHLLQVEAAGQVALGQVVAELWNTEQSLLHAHGFTAAGHRRKHKHGHGDEGAPRDLRIESRS